MFKSQRNQNIDLPHKSRVSVSGGVGGVEGVGEGVPLTGDG